jgi:hypothetical protein
MERRVASEKRMNWSFRVLGILKDVTSRTVIGKSGTNRMRYAIVATRCRQTAELGMTVVEQCCHAPSAEFRCPCRQEVDSMVRNTRGA